MGVLQIKQIISNVMDVVANFLSLIEVALLFLLLLKLFLDLNNEAKVKPVNTVLAARVKVTLCTISIIL